MWNLTQNLTETLIGVGTKRWLFSTANYSTFLSMVKVLDSNLYCLKQFLICTSLEVSMESIAIERCVIIRSLENEKIPFQPICQNAGKS
jgi:hypothetical protein